MQPALTDGFMGAAIATAAGYKVGAYTSPHVRHLTERISTSAAAPISADAFEALLQEHVGTMQAVGAQEAEGGGLSHFEAVTALMFTHFEREKVDIAFVETGMGGATDATNVIPAGNLQSAVITPIGLEHVAALGGSLQSIAAAKSGIMKPGRPVIIAQQPEAEAMSVLQKAASEQGSPAVLAHEVVQVTSKQPEVLPAGGGSGVVQEVDVCSTQAAPPLDCKGIATRLGGDHQNTNIATAVASVLQLREQGWKVPDDAVQRGLQEAFLPGRFQVGRKRQATPCLAGGSPAQAAVQHASF